MQQGKRLSCLEGHTRCVEGICWFEFTGTTLEEMTGWGWQKVHDPELLIIDATSKADRTRYFRLLNSYPPRGNR